MLNEIMLNIINKLLLFLILIVFKVISDDNEYKKCLLEKTNAGSSVLMRFEETSVSLECDVCLPPGQNVSSDVVEWLFNSSQNSNITNESVEFFDNTIIRTNGTLNMYNLQIDQSGRYWCSFNETVYSTLYFLNIDNGSEPMRLVHPNETPKEATLLVEYNLKVYSEYTPWSSCSKCGEVGKKVRYGYCTITSIKDKIIHNEDGHLLANTNYTDMLEKEDYYYDNNIEGREKRTMNKDDNDDISYFVDKVLPKFRNKLPCRSKYTPKVLQNLPSVKYRKSEMITGICKVDCQKNAIFEVRDKFGRILEKANNSAGIYSIIQGIPEALPMPVRTTLYKEYDTPFELKCPGMHSDTPVSWKIGLENLIPSEIKHKTSNRIYVNKHGHIVFKKLRYSDSNIYSCWQENKLSGVIRLRVTKEILPKFNSHILMLGSITILSVFLLVFWRAFKGRKRSTKH